MTHKRKILMIRLSAIGDVLFTLPAVTSWIGCHPGDQVTWLVEDKAAAILEHRQDLHEIIVYERARIRHLLKHPFRWPALIGLLAGHLGRIRKNVYDEVYDFQGNLKSAMHTLLARSGCKIGFDGNNSKEMSHLVYDRRVSPPKAAVHRVDKALALLFPTGHEQEIARPDLQIPGEVARRAQSVVQDLFPGIGGVHPLAVMHPGTSAFGAFKRWPAERFGLLALRLYDAFGLRTLITWGPGEEELADRAAGASEGRAVVAPRTRSIVELAGLIAQATLFVAADSGPLHLANLMGIPCAALFGPKEPEVYKPYFRPCTVVTTGVCCSPCSVRRCDDPICMTGIDVDRVFDASAALLKTTASQP